jgi:hypothetical protein
MEVWMLGGEIIRRRHDDPDLARLPVQTLLLGVIVRRAAASLTYRCLGVLTYRGRSSWIMIRSEVDEQMPAPRQTGERAS